MLNATKRVGAMDREQLEKELEKARPRLINKVITMVHNMADAEDIVQKAELKAFQHWQEYNGGSSFLTWIYSIAVNEALQWLRSKRGKYSHYTRTESLDAKMETGFDMEDRRQENPEQICSYEEMLEFVMESVEEMSLIQRETFLLRVIEGMSMEDMVEHTQRSKRSLSIALQFVRRQLKEHPSRFGIK